MTAKATLRQFRTELAKHAGATLDENTADYDFHIDTPKGFVWKSSGNHCLTCTHTTPGFPSAKAEAYAELIERMSPGLEPCDVPECDICDEKE